MFKGQNDTIRKTSIILKNQLYPNQKTWHRLLGFSKLKLRRLHEKLTQILPYTTLPRTIDILMVISLIEYGITFQQFL